MSVFVKNSTDFGADCARTDGECMVVRDNIIVLDEAHEHLAIDRLQRRCGSVVIIPDGADDKRAWLYHTSCKRMADVVERIFDGHLHTASAVAQPDAEMMIGELHRRQVGLPLHDCRSRVDGFDF